MVDQIRSTLRERIERGATLEEIDTIVRMSRGLRPSERTELWLWAWSYSPEPRLAETAAPALH
ncbi:MAG: hypothetical protein QOC95_1263 [Thermoleophilaceae bacterium]|jgi:hypothetical protein|nr:hypothetical protein [Thermoleophilaceae bacterium]